VEVKFQDYRDIDGKYDHIVSIEMFEALGEQYWKQYFSKLYSLLKPGGHLVIQSITINNNDFKTYRKGTDFIQQYIFPGGMLPSPEVFKSISQKIGFINESEKSFGIDYALTLQKWEEEFTARLDKIKLLGFDNKFLRTWRFYLKYCQGAFEAGHISVYQFQLKK
jgi:cyclopropane-fatty-acyl-phospholipid synthase